MKALVKTKPERGITLIDIPKPAVGYNDVLIQVKKTAICGTDVHIYEWDDWAKQHIQPPLVIGHEFTGVVVEIGQGVTGLKPGDRVSGEGHISCGHCRPCRAHRAHLCRRNQSVGITCQGGFAEYVTIPATNAYPIPENITETIAAILDPLGNAAHTALSFDLVGEDILITGAGPVGLMACAIARKIGARHIVISDVNEYRLNLAKNCGATLAIHPDKTSLKEVMQQLSMKEGFDVGFEMSGNAHAFKDMVSYMNNAGKIALLGFLPDETTIQWSNVIMKGLQIKGIYGREIFETWYKMISLLQTGLDISPVITHEFKADKYEEAFELAASKKSGKIVLDWGK